MTVLVDTNILLDVIQQRKPYDAPAARLWKLVEEHAVTGYVSAISYNNLFYIARKQLGRDRAMEAVKLIRQTFQLVPLDEAVIDRALLTPAADFEDAIQAAAAIRIGATYVITRNIADFEPTGIPAVTAEEFLALLQP